ncbi:MAG: hypothetical protein IPM37_11780 [Hahellaceae bacterium]|nr:hypothetical protein [Hahellaceae bacterium]
MNAMNHASCLRPFPRRTMVSLAVILSLSGCNQGMSGLAEYDYENACVTVPVINTNEPQPIYTNGPIDDADSLSAGINFDYSERITGTMPGPSSGTGLTFSNVVVTDKTIQSLFVRGSVPDGKRIGALFFEVNGTGEYFGIPIEPGGATGSTNGSPITVTLRGPFPIEGTEPEPDIITTEIIADVTVKAFLVDEDAEAPDVETTFDGIDDDANWLLPDTGITITAQNVGTGGLTATLFWDTATDIDLHMVEPDGHEIFYPTASRNSVAGDGYLDFDDTSGYGPENIFFSTDIPTGVYTVSVVYYGTSLDPAPATNWSVSISACGSTRAFTGQLTSVDEEQEVFSFVYGENCTIEPVEDPPKSPGIFEEAVLCDPESLESLNQPEEE